MKKKTGKWIRLAGILFIIGVLTLVIYESFAAYTSFNSVKRVVSTGTQSDTMFSSNYLSQLNLDDVNYPVKRISLAEKDGTSTFVVQVCNYILGDSKRYNLNDITYKVTAQLYAMDGGKLPDNITEIKMNNKSFDKNGTCTLENQELKTGSAKKNEYRFVIPVDLKDKVKIQVVAEPSEGSKETVNRQKLAAVFSFADYEAVKSWTGHFLDSQANGRTPDDYDAFNYEISGNGAGTVTMTWPESLQLSKWMTGGERRTNDYKFEVDGETTAVQFQFYRNPEKISELSGKSWADLEQLVKVTFTEKVEGK
uniref:hypothetical protein n=1 Tax=Blautia faecicola TaxID=2509240 RepID=UPI00351FAE16